MTTAADNAPAKVLHSPADDALVELLDGLRLWEAEAAVDHALRDWANARGWSIRDASEVAQELRGLGRHDTLHIKERGVPDPGLDRESVAGIAAFMLVNVARGRAATDYGLDAIVGIPDRTRRRYIATHGIHADTAWMDAHYGYGIALAALVRGGRTEQTARAWIRRNPGRPYTEAFKGWRDRPRRVVRDRVGTNRV